MIDAALLASIVATMVIPAYFVMPLPSSGASAGLLDVALGPLAIGVMVGRAVALGFDDAGSLSRLSDFMILRSGVEFWPGVLAGCAWMIVGARRDGIPITARLAAISVPGLTAWALYEATCVLRDGCPGPVSTVGLRPAGLTETMLPVGLLVGAAAAGCAVLIRRRQRTGLADMRTVLVCIATIGALRALSSFWLPHIGDGLTRQHRTSIAVTVATALGLWFERRHTTRACLPEPTPA